MKRIIFENDVSSYVFVGSQSGQKIVWFRFKANYADTPKYDSCRGNRQPDQNLCIWFHPNVILTKQLWGFHQLLYPDYGTRLGEFNAAYEVVICDGYRA